MGCSLQIHAKMSRTDGRHCRDAMDTNDYQPEVFMHGNCFSAKRPCVRRNGSEVERHLMAIWIRGSEG